MLGYIDVGCANCGDLHYLRKWQGPNYARAYQAIVWICSLYRFAKRQWSRQLKLDDPKVLADEIAFYRAILSGCLEADLSTKSGNRS